MRRVFGVDRAIGVDGDHHARGHGNRAACAQHQVAGAVFHLALGNAQPRLIPQALEGSNVSAIEAMTRLIDQSRSFETQIRIIKETKALDESGACMMKPA